MKTVYENNQIIAEFMGGKTKSTVLRTIGDRMTDDEHWLPFHGIVKFSHLKYHSSWDWLMPVVRKIVEYSVNESEDAFMSDVYTSILDTIPLASIEDGYKVVIEFIEWYNEQENNENK
jgi:hypothetical protein